MITTESEIRIALQAVLVSVLALYGFWGCAFVVLVILLPWKPFLTVGGYLAQPVVDWRLRKAREHHENGLAQIEKQLDAFLAPPKGDVAVPAAASSLDAVADAKPSRETRSDTVLPIQPQAANMPALQELPMTAQDLSATLEIPSAITEHVRNLPQGVFSNMELEVEQVKFKGDTAEAYVRFQSPTVKELVIRQRYVLRRSGSEWEVESRQPANGASKAPHYSIPSLGQPMSFA